MASSVSPITNAAQQADLSQSSTTTSTQDAIANKDVFLKLLVSQIKNQDPLNPMDSMNFVSQLAQFSQLEAILGMRSDLQAIAKTQTDTGTGA